MLTKLTFSISCFIALFFLVALRAGVHCYLILIDYDFRMTDVVSQPAAVATSIESQPSPQPVIKVEPAVTQHQQPPDTNSENSQNGSTSISNAPSPAVPDITDSPKKPIITEKPDIAPDGKLLLNAEPKVCHVIYVRVMFTF